MNIELHDAPATDDLQIISQGIKAYNQAYLPDEVVFEPDTRFAVFARNGEGCIVGGIRANAYWNYCLIELLWLTAEVRGVGVGSKLVAETERYARSKGFRFMRTETVDFQAKPFYEKLGYEVYGQLADFPAGHTTYCLVKKL